MVDAGRDPTSPLTASEAEHPSVFDAGQMV
jgi:hypothetical protein